MTGSMEAYVIIAAATDYWDHAAFRNEKADYSDGLILWEVKAV
jgi:hypothetical protein